MQWKWLFYIKTICLLSCITSMIITPCTTYAQSNEIPTEQIDQFVQSTMRKLHIPGVSVGIINNEKVIYTQGYGVAGPNNKSMTPSTGVVIGSLSKSFTALAIMQLVQKKKINLNAPVQTYLPWFRVDDPKASSQITINHLLHQTSGLSTQSGIAAITQQSASIEEHVRHLQKVKLTAKVGTTYQYSNLNYNILGAVIESVSHQSYSDYIKQYIFQPLHMNHSYTSIPLQTQDIATGYQPVFGFMFPTSQLEHKGTVPSGYLYSNVEDMSNYMMMQMNKGIFQNKNLLSSKNIQLMHTGVSDMGNNSKYAMGWIEQNKYIWHNGSTENTFSEMRIHNGYGIIVLANSIDVITMYGSLLQGIDDILNGSIPSSSSTPDFIKLYSIADGIALICIVLFLWSIYSLFHWRKAFKPTTWRILINITLVICCNIVVPVILFYFIKSLAPWSVIITFLPGLGHGLIALPIVLIMTGILKVILMIKAIKEKRNTLYASKIFK